MKYRNHNTSVRRAISFLLLAAILGMSLKAVANQLQGNLPGDFLLKASNLSDVSNAATARSNLGLANANQRAFGITIDGGGSAITTGIKGDVILPFAGTITQWTLVADQSGSIVIDVWKDVYANFPPTVFDTIAGSEKPTLATATNNQDTNLTTWSPAVSVGDVVRFNVDSAATVTRVTLVINVTTP